MTSAISFHVIYDAIDSDPNPLRVAIASLRPRVINIVGGARKTQAFSFAIELLKKYPDMRVIFRNFPDDGNHALEKYKLKWHRDVMGSLIVDDYSGCQRWIDDNQNYLLAGLTVLTDNESVNDNMDVYAAWQAKIMDLCGAKGWKVAVGRFAVGNPREADYKRMAAMWRSLAKWHPLHTWSPNEYIPPDMKFAAGMINRYQQGIDAANAMTPPAWPFDVSIGEYGIVYRNPDGSLDAFAGYRDSRIGWGGEKAFKYLYDQWVTWYKQNSIDVCIYGWGGDGTPKWERFRVDTDNGFIKAITDANSRGELEPVPTKPVTKPFLTPMPKPENATAAIRVRVLNAIGINVRSGAGTEYTRSRALEKGAEVTLYRSPFKQAADGKTWRWIDISEVEGGWISYDDLQWEEIKPPVPTVPPPTSPPPVIVLPPVTPPVPPITPEMVRIMTEDDKKIIYDAIATMQSAMLTIVNVIGSLQKQIVDKAA